MKKDREIKLNPTEAAVLYVLTTKHRFAPASKIAELLGWSEAHTRKILSDLRSKGLTDYVMSGFLGRGATGLLGLMGAKKEELKEIGEMDPRVKLHFATITFEKLKTIYPDIEKWEELAKKQF
ncbi:MAG: hypothetical protein QXL77_06525 [Candidatus Bathyarchaeia archaeon]